MKTRSTKRMLLMSVISLFLCLTMFVGSTFAWFTDSVTSGNNKIVAGTLNIELYHSNSEETDEKIESTTDDLFPVALWEPGVATYENFTIKNEGTLALTYIFDLNIADFNTTPDNKSIDDALKVALIEDSEFSGTREDLVSVFNSDDEKITVFDSIEDVTLTGAMDPKSEKNFTVALYWEPSGSDNDFNMNNDKTTSDGQPLFVDVAVALLATQYTQEKDSFDDQYDAGALTTVDNAQELQAAVNDGGIVIVEGVYDEAITLNVPVDVTLIITKATFNNTISVNTENEAVLTVQNGKTKDLVVTGNGTVALDNVVATADDGMNALTVGAVSLLSVDAVADNTVKIAINGATKLNGGKGASGLYVAAGTTLDLSGTGCLSAVGNGGVEYFQYSQYSTTTDESYKNLGGHGIGGDGNIYIHDLALLSAEGYGKAGCGIGGNTPVVKIENTKIEYVRGGFVNQTGEMVDAQYNKGEPEGGAAIGGCYNGMEITLDNVTISDAIGGGKSAGIGARHWTAVTVNINNSTIENVVGGPSAAGIGGSRVKQNNNSTQVTVINIADSKISAQGGYFGAGIGSGYDTYCQDYAVASRMTLNITGNSDITAVGGKYAAGIGTGYHNAALMGGIEDTVKVNAKAGKESFYKAEYSVAQAVGFGVIDPKREGAENNVSEFYYNGNTLTCNDVEHYVADGLKQDEEVKSVYYVTNANGLATINELLKDTSKTEITKIELTADIDFSGKTWTPVDMHADKKGVLAEINGNGHTISNLTINGQAMFTRFAQGNDLVIKDLTFDNAVVNSTALNSSILTVQTYTNLLLDNVDVVNSSITGAYKVAPLVATVYNEKSSTVTLTVKNCDVSNTTVKSTVYDFCTTGMVAYVRASDNDKVEFENCTISDVTLIAPDDDYGAHAAVYTTGSGSLYNEAEGVTVSNVTFEVLD